MSNIDAGAVASTEGLGLLPPPDLYAQELIANGSGVWLGCVEAGICERAHTPGETGEEIRHYYTADTVRRLLAAERERWRQAGWVCADGFPALLGHKPLKPGAKLYASTDDWA